jgi:hypothetical protein
VLWFALLLVGYSVAYHWVGAGGRLGRRAADAPIRTSDVALLAHGGALAQMLPEDAVVAGDWSSLLGLGTELRTLYVDRAFNRPERIKELRPSFFLHSEMDGGRELMR